MGTIENSLTALIFSQQQRNLVKMRIVEGSVE